MRLAFLCALMAFPAVAQWQRIVYSGKGETIDVPAAHPLSYFTGDAFLRDDGYDLCADCSPQGKAQSARKYSVQTEVKPVGTLAGYRIVDVLCRIRSHEDDAPAQVKWKFILVEVAPDRYKEIFHLQAFYTTISIEPSRIIESGSESVLATMDSDGGNGGGCWQGYWWFDRNGPHALDFSRLQGAMTKATPANTRFSAICSDLDLHAQQVHSGVQKSETQCRACDWAGEVTATFHLNGAMVEPDRVTFMPTHP